jgi:hypothetical protein
MGYIRPAVHVFQNLVNPSAVVSPPDLETLIIGPNYQVLDKEQVIGVTYDPVLGNTFSYPNLEIGAKVDLLDHMDIYFKNCVVTKSAQKTGGTLVTNSNILKDAAATFITDGVQTEDRVRLVSPTTGLTELYIVDAVLSETEIQFFGKSEYSTNQTIGTNAQPFAPVMGTSDKLSIKVDGGTAQEITLANTDTAAALVVAKINATLTGAVASATTDNKVKIVSNTARGSVEFVTITNNAYTILGFTVGKSTATYRIVNDVKDFTEVKIRNPIDNVDPNTDFAASADGITLDPGIKAYTTDGGSFPIETVEKIYITYRALRTAKSGEIVDIESLDDIQGKIGKIDVRNPLAVGASIAVQNTISRIRTFAIDEDNSQGYLEVLDRIEETDEVYCIVPLTQDTTVAAAIRSHVDNLSVAEEGKWRIMFWSPELIREKVAQELSSAGTFQYDNTTGILTMEDTTNGSFVSRNIVPTDYIRILDEDIQGNPQVHPGVYKVLEVISEQKVKLQNMKYTGEEGSAEYIAGTAFAADFADISVDYETFRVLDLTGIADSMALLADSYKDKRVYQVLPDQVEITLSDGDHIVPGYYLCCALGGMVAGAPPHQGFTNLGITGVKQLYHSNKYFKQSQLDKMAEYGVYIVVQDVVGALPYTRHQISTDVIALETRECSLVKNIDFSSYFFKRGLRRFLGIYNITPATLAAITTQVHAMIVYLTEQTYPRIGAPLISGEIVRVVQDDTFKDKVRVELDMKYPYPVNNIRVDLMI